MKFECKRTWIGHVGYVDQELEVLVFLEVVVDLTVVLEEILLVE